jgi:hypothetical protein
MRRTRTEKLARVEENYIFYTCLALVLAIAAFGVFIDLTGR